MMEPRVIAQLVKSGRQQEALDLLAKTAQNYRDQRDAAGLAHTIHQQAALLLETSPGECLSLCTEAEEILRSREQPLQVVQVQLTSCQAMLALGDWQSATRRLDECRYSLGRLDPDFQIDLLFRLRISQVLVEAAYLGYQQGADNLEDLYHKLLDLAEQLEQVRRMRPGDFNTVWLFGELDLYERIVAVAYQLGLVTQAANWAERTKSRRLLDLLLNLPFGQENPDE